METPVISAARIPRYRTTSRTKTIAAPIGGWNAKSAIGEMPPLDAVTLTNFWPGTSSVYLRKGYTQFATGFGSNQVETLMAYSGGTTNTLFAAAGTKI